MSYSFKSLYKFPKLYHASWSSGLVSIYEQALAQIELLWESPQGSSQANDLEILTILVEEYENRVHFILPPDPIEAVIFRMEQEGLENADIAEYFGGISQVTEVLTRQKKLTLEMIRLLHLHLRIPLESLILAV